jgi:hypothetical protein
MDARRILVQFGALSPLLLMLLVTAFRGTPSFVQCLLWPACAAAALTAFLCLVVGLEAD